MEKTEVRNLAWGSEKTPEPEPPKETKRTLKLLELEPRIAPNVGWGE